MILIPSVLPAGAPNQVHIEAVPFEITEDRVTLRWTAPRDNGAVITEYTIYSREVNEDGSRSDWEGNQTGLDILQHEVVGLKTGKLHEFQITARNRWGESPRRGRAIIRDKVLGKILKRSCKIQLNKNN